MVLLFSFLESIQNAGTYLPIFQASAGSSQGGAANIVQHRLAKRAP